MNDPVRHNPGPVKKYERYLTIPLIDTSLEALEKIKWRSRLDKTEIMRRVMDYFLTMSERSQDDLLKSFDEARRAEDVLKRAEAGRKKKQKVKTGLRTVSAFHGPHPKTNAMELHSPPDRPNYNTTTVPQPFKRSGLP